MPLLKNGQRLGAYVIDGLLAEGGMAEVYRATHQALDREVAIKVLNPTFNGDPTFPLRFLREAKLSAKLNHPNIIHVYDFDTNGEIAYLVMELATGGTLSDRTGRLTTLRQAIDALGPVFDAVAYAHTRGVVHRDIKPENVLLTELQRPVLADFGLARLLSENLTIQGGGAILGTPYYMAPEQVLGDDVDHRADIYALGVLTYASLAGRVPFDGSSFMSIARRHLKAPPPSIREVLPCAPERLDAAIQRAMAKSRVERFATAAAFHAELRRAMAESPDLSVGAIDVAARAPWLASPRSPDGPARTVIDTSRSFPSDVIVGESGVQCPTCRSFTRPGVRFCTACGGRMPALPLAGARSAITDDDDDDVFGSLFGEADLLLDPAFARVGRPRLRRPPSALGAWQWGALALAALVALSINAIGLWAARAGRAAVEGGAGAAIVALVSDNLPGIKSGMALVALLLAGLASYAIWVVVLDPRQRSPESCWRLRQFHRLTGYIVALTAFSIGVLSCAGIYGFDLSTPRRALHTVIGTALLVLIVAKVAVVRRMARYRRYLNVLGGVVLAFYGLAVLTSAVPWLWQQAGVGGR